MDIKRFSVYEQNDNSELPEEMAENSGITQDDEGFPEVSFDSSCSIGDSDVQTHDENDINDDEEESDKKYQKMMEEFTAQEEKEKEEKRRNDFNYVKVEDIDRSDPDVNDYVANVLVPGLLEFTKSNKYHYSLIRLFHRLGCSASFAFALAGVFHDVAHALQMAVESSEDKIVWAFEDDVAKAERVIVCYRKMFHKFDESTVFAFNKDDTWREHHEPLNFISFISPFKFQRTYEK